MFDTMTWTKIIGAFCGSLLVLMLGKWAADGLYTMGGGGHGGEEHAAYVIEVAGGDGNGEAKAAEEGPSFADMLAEADIGKGAKIFSKCKACHKLEPGANATGPALYGVVGRAVGTSEGFGYSGSLVAVAQTWDPETLNHFLTSPKNFAPGTKMTFSGLKKMKDRANLIAYLDSLDD